MAANDYTIDTNTFFPIVIPGATHSSAGLMSAADKTKLDTLLPSGALAVVTNATRALAATLPIGSVVFNSDDNAPNYVGFDGANNQWYDAAGNLT